MQIDVNRRLVAGFQIRGNYTWSKNLDMNSALTVAQGNNQPQLVLDRNDLGRDWGPSALNTTHQSSISSQYELPFGNGKRWLNGATGLRQKLASGWQLNGISTLLSGFPFTPIRPKTKKNMDTLQNQNSLRPYNDGHLYVDLRRELVILDSQVLALTRKEYCVLILLVQHAGEVVTRTTLSRQVWGHAHGTGGRKVENNVRGLKSKLGIYADRYIQTVRGVGYRFRPASPLFYKGRTYSC